MDLNLASSDGHLMQHVRLGDLALLARFVLVRRLICLTAAQKKNVNAYEPRMQ